MSSTILLVIGLFLFLLGLALGKRPPFIRGCVFLQHRTKLIYSVKSGWLNKSTDTRQVVYSGNIIDDDEGIIYQIKASITIRPKNATADLDTTELCLVNVSKVFLDEIKARMTATPQQDLLKGPNLLDGFTVSFHSDVFTLESVATTDCR